MKFLLKQLNFGLYDKTKHEKIDLPQIVGGRVHTEHIKEITPNNSRGGRERQYLLLHFEGRSLVRAGTAAPKLIP